MKPKLFFAPLVLIIASALLAVVSASAQGGYYLDWWTVDGGGGSSANGAYSLSGTVGQLDAGIMAGGCFTLSGGFWPGGEAGVPPGHELFLPLILH